MRCKCCNASLCYLRSPEEVIRDRFHFGFLGQDRGIIDDSAGLYRAYRNPIITRTIENGRIDFYCVGHADDIADLLAHMPAIGKKPSMGFGIIKNFAITECDDDYTVWHPDFGLMRPIPVAEADERCNGYPIFRYAIKPPYWKSCNMTACYVPVR